MLPANILMSDRARLGLLIRKSGCFLSVFTRVMRSGRSAAAWRANHLLRMRASPAASLWKVDSAASRSSQGMDTNVLRAATCVY